ncbi:MAG: FG-GAP-like repeat-containing protein, partial [Xanthomonadales bacterium]|nr:FG-GAP-like repeat-containing protein [Xanthomonadales bacterium]
MHYKRRTFIVILLIAGLLAYFWLGSRYPAIDEKAVMAGSFMLEDVLSFEATFEVSTEYPAWKRIGLSTLNWIMTNRQGMTFGVLLAALVLTLLQAWPLRQKRGRTLTDILKGVLIGAPLGVCVNCAAPIAYGMQKEGVRSGTSMATLFASPTLNIVVLTMMFSLLPFYMATTRVVVTFLFLLLVLPLLLRLTGRNADKPAAEPDSPAIDCAVPASEEGWFAALAGTAKDFLRNLLFIVVRTVPLMLLAGFLGTAMATVLPLESVTGWQVSLAGMAAVALLGTFAPVPIAFDIVVVQALLVIGMAPEYAMVLLVTLGMFSIYPLLLVSKMTTWRFSLAVFAAVALLGLSAGYFAGGYQAFTLRQNQELFESRFGLQPETPGQVTSTASPVDDEELSPDKTSHTAETRRGNVAASIRVDSTPHLPRASAGSLPFGKTDGRSMGLLSSDQQVLDLMMPFSQGRGLASGDFDGDGWPDLAVAQNRGITLYRNIQGRTFEDVTPEIPGLENTSVLLVAFVDMDNDGCLDLFAGGFGDKDHFLVNDCAGFKQARLIPLNHETALMTQAAAFADHDRDGDLDLLKGNWFFLFPRTLPSPRNTNYLAINQGNFSFRQNRLEEIEGATLAVLMSDFNNDGLMDKLIGNDFMEPDFYYRGKGNGGFARLKSGGAIPQTTL